jgi:hypothetical protein
MKDKPAGAFSARVKQIGQTLYASVKGYVLTARSEAAGLAALKTLFTSGPLFWPGLAVLIASVLATAYLALQRQGLPLLMLELWEGEKLSLPAPALWLALPVIACAWAYLLAGAARRGPVAYALAALYVGYFGLMPGLACGRFLWFALVPIWLLLQGTWVASSRPGFWRWPSLLALSLLAGLLTYKPLGFKAILAGGWGQFALGLLWFALAANPWVLKPRRFRFGLSLGLNLAVFLLFYGLVLWKSPPGAVAELTFLSLHDLLGVVGLFWYWLGLDLFNSAQGLADWVTDTAARLLPGRALRGIIFGLWAVWLALAYLKGHMPPPWLLEAVYQLPLGPKLLALYQRWQPSFSLATVLRYDLYVTAALVLVALVLGIWRKLSSERLQTLFDLSLLGLLILWGGVNLYLAVDSGLGEEGRSFWSLLLYVGGMFWQILMNSADLIAGGLTRRSLFSGFLLCVAGIALLELSAGYSYFNKTVYINTFAGALYLGLPYMLYTFLYRQRRYTPVAPAHLLLLFALGLLSAIPALLWGRWFLAPALWLALLGATVWRLGRWDDPLDGVVYGVALALGFTVQYTHPILIPVPSYIAALQALWQVQETYMQQLIWPWQPAWWAIFLGTGLAGGILGWFCGRARAATGRRRAAWLALGLAAGVGAALVAAVLAQA